MAADVAELIRAGLALDPDDRAVLADRLIASLDEARHGDDEAGVDAAWRDEIARRLSEVSEGTVTLIDADEHYAQVFDRFASRPE